MEHFDWLYGAVFPYINFLIFAGALVYFLRSPLTTMAAKRRQSFEVALIAAQKARVEAEAMNAELTKRLKGLEREFSELQQVVVKEAKAEELKLTTQATAVAEHLRSEAQRIADFEVESAKKKLRADMVQELTVLVETHIKNKLPAEQKSVFLNQQISSIGDISTRGHA